MSDEIRRLSDDLARDPSSLVFMRLADALRRAGQLDVALHVAVRGLERHPYLADAHDVLARIYADRGDLERAADEWAMTLRLDPAHGPARLGLGFVDYRRGDLESAERRLAAASGGDADASVAAALAHVRGALSMRLGNGTAVAAPAVERAFAPLPALESEPATRVSQPAAPAAVTELPAPDLTQPRHLFAPALDAADQTALLVDGDGLVLAGTYVDATGQDVAEVVAAELAGVSGEAERAMRHLALGAWTSLLVEANEAVVAMTPAPGGNLLVVAASRETPVGLVRLLLDRALTRARDWLARVS